MGSHYNAYLQTGHWKAFRKLALKEHGEVCKDCGAVDTRFDVHHLTYENLGQEQLEDVVVLCHSCHMDRHPDKFNRMCKHERLEEASGGYGSGTLSFYWFCADCKSLVGNREPTEKEKIMNIKEAERHRKWREKEDVRQAKRDEKKREREAIRKEKKKLNPKPKKKKKRKTYKKRVVTPSP